MSDPTSVVGRRVVAFVVDAVVVLVLFAVVWQSQAHYVDSSGTSIDTGEVCRLVERNPAVRQCVEVGDRAYFVTDGRAAGVFAFGLALQLAYFVVLQGLTGRTPGKLITGLRTVGEDGRPPGLGRAALRWLVLIVDGFPYLAPLVGFVLALTTPGHRRLGDMAAKTFVIASDRAGAPVPVPGVTAPPAGAWVPPPAGWGPGNGGWGPPAGPAGGWGAPAESAGRGGTERPPGAWEPPGARTGWQVPAPTGRPGDEGSGWQAPAAGPKEATPRTGEAEAPDAEADAAPTEDEATATWTSTGTYEPQWDDARGTYIQWDPDRARWVQWEQGPQRWVEIPGQ